MITVTPGTNCWHVHRQGILIGTAKEESVAHQLADTHRNKSLSGTLEAIESSGLDCNLNDTNSKCK